jgi:resuscitation-promoting factor RpfB
MGGENMGIGLGWTKFCKKEPLSLILIFFIVAGSLFTLTSFILVRDVTIDDQGTKIHLHTFSHKVEDVLREAGLTLHSKDQVWPDLDESLPRVAVIEITRAYPVFVRVDGQEFDCWVTEGRVEDILAQTGIRLGELDTINQGQSVNTTPYMIIEITRVFKQVLTEKTVLSFREVKQQNPSVDRGFSRVIQKGQDGLREDIIEVTYADGKESERDLVESIIIRPRKDRIVEEGSNTLLAARGGLSVRFIKAMYVQATAYCPGTAESGCPINEKGYSRCTGKNSDGYTATGVKAVAGTGDINNPHIISVDPRLIPLGSRVYIAGYGFARALDVGSAIKGQRIDLLLPTHSAALRFGRRQLKIYLLP